MRVRFWCWCWQMLLDVFWNNDDSTTIGCDYINYSFRAVTLIAKLFQVIKIMLQRLQSRCIHLILFVFETMRCCMVTVCGMVLSPAFHVPMCFYLPMCAHGKHISLSLCLSDSVKNALLCIDKNDRDKIKPYWVLLPFSCIAILEILFVIISWCVRLKANQKKKSPCMCVCRLHVESFGSGDSTMQCTSKVNVLLQIACSSKSYRHLPNYIRSKKINSFLKLTKSCS